MISMIHYFSLALEHIRGIILECILKKYQNLLNVLLLVGMLGIRVNLDDLFSLRRMLHSILGVHSDISVHLRVIQKNS